MAKHSGSFQKPIKQTQHQPILSQNYAKPSSQQAKTAQRGKPSQQRGKDTRADILKLARRLFSEHGYHHTGIADIQQSTGLTKGAFYHHFRTKEHLALAVLEQARSDYEQNLFAPARQQDNPRDRLLALLDSLVTLYHRPTWSTCQMLVTLSSELTIGEQRLREMVQKINEELFENIQQTVEEAQQNGDLDNHVPPKVLAQWIINTVTGTLLARKLGQERVPLEQMIERIKAQLLTPSEPA